MDAKLLITCPGLHRTFAKAYALLTKINLKIGWDNLLKTRSSVFVMEEVALFLDVNNNRNIVLKEGNLLNLLLQLTESPMIQKKGVSQA